MMNAIIVALPGYSVDDRSLSARLTSSKVGIEEGDTFPQVALHVSGLGYGVRAVWVGRGRGSATDPRQKCADWIRKQVRKPGDWKIKNPKGEPGGWYLSSTTSFILMWTTVPWSAWR
jgi:hypothetical protein